MLRLLAAELLFALASVQHGVEHRYAIISGPDYVIVGRHMFYDYVYTGACTKVDRAEYRFRADSLAPIAKQVVVHRCYV